MISAKNISAKNIEAAVFSAIDRLGAVLPPGIYLERSRAAPLLADGTSLDSMAVVNLLVFIEEEMLSTLGVEIMLTGAGGDSGIDPEAFGTIGALIDAICQYVLCPKDVAKVSDVPIVYEEWLVKQERVWGK